MSLPPLHVRPRFDELSYVPPYTKEALARWRGVGDPLADAVVADLAALGPLGNIHDLLGAVRARARSGDPRAAELLHEATTVPAWADFSAMEKGQRLIASYAPWMGISLFSGSLVGGAMFIKMARVTAMTGMFSGKPGQRLTQTTAMVTRMAFPGSVQPGGEAHEVWLRVRLLHAGIRHLLVASGRYRHPTEVPINQQDLAITLALFGYVNVRQLMQLGVRLDRAQIDSFILLWRYAGHVLGIDGALLPRSIEEQQAFYLSSCLHQVQPEKVPPETKQLLDVVARTSKVIPYPVARTFLHQITRYLAGDDYIAGMQVAARARYWGIPCMRGLGRAASFAQRHVPFGEQAFYEGFARLYRREFERNERRNRYRYRVQTDERTAHRPEAASAVA
jgi:hypothetical protein